MPEIKTQDLFKQIDNHLKKNEYNQAEILARLWSTSKPDQTRPWTCLGVIYSRSGRHEAALSCYERALKIDPDAADILSNYGVLLTRMGDLDKAEAVLRKAHALEPDKLFYRQNLVYTLRDNKKFDEAIKHQEFILKQKPKDQDALFELGFIHFYALNYKEGWAYYMHRMRKLEVKYMYETGIKRFDGQDLKGKKILIMGEQGFGDTILILRFFKKLLKDSDQVTLVANAPLFPLLEPLGINCITYEEFAKNAQSIADEHDYGIELADLPPLYEKNWNKWPAQPKFTIPESSKQKFAWLQDFEKKRLKVGIVWSGSVTFKINYKRAAEYTRFLKLTSEYPDIQFFSFQKGPREEDMKTHGQGCILTLGHVFENFGDTAAALENMDLIIMTDSALAHLAGTLDIPVLNLLCFRPYWLYFPETPKTKLYKSMRFIRQTKDDAWDPVFDKTREILSALQEEHEQNKKRLSSTAILKTIDTLLK